MKKLAVLLAAATSCMAQSGGLGVHNCGERGCIACHTPHSDASGNGALWGQNLTPVYGQTVASGGFASRSVVSLPASVREAASAKDRNFTIIVCLSCHDGSVARNNSRHHPVGPGATSGWDHAVAGQREVFARNYRFPSKNNTQTITCTTCHDPHNQTMWSGEIGGVQANWRTSFFVRGPYSSSGGNAAAQFCRSCHADKSNEMHGLMNVPTIGVRQL